MKKKGLLKLSLATILLFSFSACQNIENELLDSQKVSDVQEPASSNQMLEFDSEEQLLNAINGLNTRSISNLSSPNFTSLMSEVDINDPLKMTNFV
jgi:hypothetical protein